MFWGSFSHKSVGSLIPIEGIMNSQKYKSMLSDVLQTDLEKCGAEIYQDDSATCHRAKIVQDFFYQ